MCKYSVLYEHILEVGFFRDFRIWIFLLNINRYFCILITLLFFCSLLEGIRTKVFLTLSAFKFACVPVEIKVIHSLNTFY